MQCTNCRSQIQEGSAFCQHCGTPTSVSVGAPFPPTVAVSQPSYTNYTQPDDLASNPYGSTPNPYENPSSPYKNSSTTYAPPPPPPPPPPSNFPPSLQTNNAPAYGTVPNNEANMAAQIYGAPLPVKRKRNVGLVVGIMTSVILLGIIGVAIIPNLLHLGKSGSPSGKAVDAKLALILINVQMASSVNPFTATPISLATSFKTNSAISVAFQYDLNNIDVSAQKPAYIQAKWYKNSTLLYLSKILELNDRVKKGHAYFSIEYVNTTNNGGVELYWCRQSSCTDGKLAQYATFTVSETRH